MLGISVIFSLLVVIGCNHPEPTLRFAQVVLRHGDRAPVKLFPSDPNDAASWPNGLGELTKLGIQQEYELGKALRSFYKGFLNETISLNKIRVESTDYNRTLMSASAVLAGLYPPTPAQTWSDDLPWYPLPIHTRPSQQDRVLNMDVPCSRYSELEDIVYSSEEVHQYIQKNRELLAYIANASGLATNLDDVTLMDIMLSVPQPVMIERAQNLTVAAWVDDEIYQFLKDMDTQKARWWYHLEEQKRLRGGRWAYDTYQRLMGHARGARHPQIFIQAAHDSSLVAFLEVLGAWDRQVPPYASFIAVELHEAEQGQHFVKLFYKNDTIHDTHSKPVQLYFSECPAPCSLENFGDVLRPYMVSSDEEHREMCEPAEFILTLGLLMTVVAIAVLLTALVVAGVGLLFLRKPTVQPYRNLD